MKGQLAEFDSEHSYFQPRFRVAQPLGQLRGIREQTIGTIGAVLHNDSRFLSKKLGRNYIKPVYQKLD